MATRAAHDAAWSLARDLVRGFGGELGDNERVALFHELYAFVLPRIESLLTRSARERARLGRAAPPPDEADTPEGGESWTTNG